MALDKAGLKSALEVAFGAPDVSDPTSKSNIENMAQLVADAVDTFVKSGTVNTTVTIPSTSAPGSPSSGTGTGSVT